MFKPNIKRASALILAATLLLAALAGCTQSKSDAQDPTASPTKSAENAQVIVPPNEGGVPPAGSGETVVYECVDYKIVQRSYHYDGYITSYDNGKSGADKRYGFVRKTDTDTFPVTEPIYDEIMSFSEGFCAVRAYNAMEGESKWGFINESGGTLTDFKYDDVQDFKNGYAEAAIGKGTNVKWGLIDKSGNEVVPLEYIDIQSETIEDGFVTVCGARDENNAPLYGKYDIKNGKIAVPVEYYAIGNFSENLCVVKGKLSRSDLKYGFYSYGYVDNSGNLVIPLQFEYASNFHEGLAFAQTKIPEETWMGTIDRDVFIFIDKNGKQIGNHYAEAGDFHNGFAPVYGPNDLGQYTYGFADMTGTLAIPYQFKKVYPFEDGFAAVMTDNGDCHFINEKGEINDKYKLGINQDIYNEYAISPWRDGLKRISCDVGEGFRFGFIDIDTNLRANGFVDTGEISDGLIAVQKQKESKWGYISAETGETVIPYTYDYAGEFFNGVAFARVADVPDATPLQALGLIYYPFCIINDKGEQLTEHKYIGTVKNANNGKIEPIQTSSIAPFANGKTVVAVANDDGTLSYVELEIIKK